MFVILSKDYAELSRQSAGIVSAAIRKRPDVESLVEPEARPKRDVWMFEGVRTHGE
jgi:hypothetical protein